MAEIVMEEWLSIQLYGNAERRSSAAVPRSDENDSYFCDPSRRGPMEEGTPFRRACPTS